MWRRDFAACIQLSEQKLRAETGPQPRLPHCSSVLEEPEPPLRLGEFSSSGLKHDCRQALPVPAAQLQGHPSGIPSPMDTLPPSQQTNSS